MDPYVYVGTRVLKNKGYLRVPEEAAAYEARMVFKRLLGLYAEPCPGPLDTEHLLAIHRTLFQDVYAWAGKLRIGEMSIGSYRFCRAELLMTSLRALLDQLAGERYLMNLSPDEFSERAGYYLGELNAIHPFRDGNGRTQREFIRQIGLRALHKVRWAPITRFEMVTASKLSAATGQPYALTVVMRKTLGLGPQ